MFKPLLIVSLIAAALGAGKHLPALQALDRQLASVGSDTALVYPSQAIDDYPLWSPDARFLSVNDESHWQKIDIAAVVLDKGTWRGGQALGVISNRSAVSPATASNVAVWKKSNRASPRKVRVGTAVVELRASELSTALIVTRPGSKPEKRWESDEENCHSLVVAPDAQHVAFICEMNGVFVLRLGSGG